MKKICFIIPVLGNDGAERVAFHLLNNLSKDKYQLYLILTNQGGNYLKELNSNVKIIELKEKRVRYSIFKLYKVLKNLSPDIAVIFSSEIATVTGLFIAPFLKNIKFIVREINIQSILMTNVLRKLLLKLSYKSIYKIISQSKDMTDDLINYTGINANKIVEINNPIDMKQINLKLNEKMSSIELKENYKNLVCVGRLAYQKGFDLLIEVMGKLKDKKIRAYIIGDGNERGNLETKIKTYGLVDKVFLLGRKENPYVYMAKADLFILSSRFEGFPNVLIEAGACGAYSICNICPGGVNEIIRENLNGNIVNFNDANETAHMILQKLEEKHDVRRIKSSVLTRYNLDNVVSKYENFFDIDC